MKTAYVLEVEESVMCACCLKQATHFIIKIASHGELLAVCQNHLNI